ncbi:Copine-8 [Geranomyces michiganensis]|nr:Copine-8 [Geranomyces michiganensis]
MANVPHSNVELRISCRHLIDLDILSKSDPAVFVYTTSPGRNTQWRLHGTTETIQNNLNPTFTKAIQMTYLFEEVQRIKFVVYDIDKPNSQNPDDHDFLGSYETTLAALVSASGQAIQKPLQHPHRPKAGYIKVSVEEQTDLKHVVKMCFHGSKLDKKDLFGKSDPLYVISRSQEDGTFLPVYRSQHLLKTLNPTFDPAVLPIAQLCNGDRDRQLLWEVYDWNKSGSNDLIGGFSASVNEMISWQGKEIPLINKAKAAKKKNYTNSGLLRILQFYLEEVPSFLDYLGGGTSLALACAIDFTQSNGQPHLPSSLHYRNPQRQNHYQEALIAVGTILEPYDADAQFPVYGFGAKLTDGSVSHCFALNGNIANPHVHGVHGVLAAYDSAISQIQLWGPTNFSPIINQVAAQVRAEEAEVGPGLNYTVLLMITDGVITDMDATVRAIVDASHLPLSIVIVGVGNADFTSMRVLDGDDEPLSSNGRRCERDIVQFVPFAQFAADPHLLAKEVLAEIPDQLVGFMRKKGIKPRLRRAHSWTSINSQDSFASRSASVLSRGLGGGGGNNNNGSSSDLGGAPSPLLPPTPPGGNGSGGIPGRHATTLGLRNHGPGQHSSQGNLLAGRSQTMIAPSPSSSFYGAQPAPAYAPSAPPTSPMYTSNNNGGGGGDANGAGTSHHQGSWGNGVSSFQQRDYKG